MRFPSCIVLPAVAVAACVPSPSDINQGKLSQEGRAVMEQRDSAEQALAVELRAATLMDGVNVNVLKIDARSKDDTLAQRKARAEALVKFLAERGAIPRSHHRAVVDFPVTFQVGCMPVNLYDRVQVETRGFTTVQALPAKRVLGYDQAIHGEMGGVVLDDAQWNIPFFLTLDRVELAREVVGVAAKPGELFLSVHARWTNIGTGTATMGDDPWRLVVGAGPKRGELVALLDGGDTHLARNGGKVKMDPVDPGDSRERWYVYRVAEDRLPATPLAFARQRYAKTSSEDKNWQKAGFELWIPVKDGHAPAALPASGHPVEFRGDDWRGPGASDPPPPAPPSR